MGHRIFIAINFSPEIKKKLGDLRQKWPDLPARWTKPEILHITLAFLGYLNDEEILEICQICNQVGQRHKPFSLKLSRISYGPPGRKPPRIVSVQTQESEELTKLQRDLANSLFESSISTDKKPAHVTLARIKAWEIRQIEPEELPEIDEEISLTFPVNSIEVMESELKREGPEYSVLETCPLSS